MQTPTVEPYMLVAGLLLALAIGATRPSPHLGLPPVTDVALRRLRVVEPPVAVRPSGELHGARTPTLPVGPTAVGRQRLELGLPRGVLVYLVGRGVSVFVPQGGTTLHAGDTLHVVMEEVQEPEVRRLLTRGASDHITSRARPRPPPSWPPSPAS